jgi:hypothetical protein
VPFDVIATGQEDEIPVEESPAGALRELPFFAASPLNHDVLRMRPLPDRISRVTVRSSQLHPGATQPVEGS